MLIGLGLYNRDIVAIISDFVSQFNFGVISR